MAFVAPVVTVGRQGSSAQSPGTEGSAGGSEAAELLLDVLHRPYRCKDWMYALLVRHVDDADFRDRLASLAGADDPLVRLRVQFLLHLADHPEQGITRKTWGRWLESRLRDDDQPQMTGS
ncbi:hypothetical protein OG205_06270 [Lentzea sp. NBC_00516]|uniref:hypothetical protein n=1 Tax=Lentzea sp. NBC_00516 TaxID=2903582 RepID=UPI002E808E34|nr:hypothetical protein [Lentzea sp. NBC_00516]WUD26598.1 hypothetical protein OG205_06270 [Lentzea sp. NBC_00516]